MAVLLESEYHKVINKNISTRSYNFEIPRSFIVDEKNHISYFLKGWLSIFWEYIVKSKNYYEIKKFAIDNNFTDKYIPFLNELNKKEIINYNLYPNYSVSNLINFSIKHSDENYLYYKERVENLILRNNMINQLYLQLTYKCNLKCKHCFISEGNDKKEISFEDAKSIIDQAYNLGINNICISGGECTCSRDFIKIVNYIRKLHISYSFLTNGQLLYDDEILFKKIVDSYPNIIKISLYSMDDKIHDYVTGVKGSQYKTLKVIKKLKENNINVIIQSFQSKLNIGSYGPIKAFAEKINAGLIVDSTFLENINMPDKDLSLSVDELKKLYLDTDYPGNIYKLKFSNASYNKDIICEAGYKLININPDLDITPCVNYNYILGNVKKDSLSNIWNYAIPEFRKKFSFKNLIKCNNKIYCKYCKYCPALSLYSNNLMGSSHSLCENSIAKYYAIRKIKHN